MMYKHSLSFNGRKHLVDTLIYPEFDYEFDYPNQLSWLKVTNRRYYFLDCVLHSMFKYNLLIFLAMRFTPLSEIEGLRTLNRTRQDVYHVYLTNTEIMDDSFTAYGAYFWNNLNANLREVENSTAFKTALFNLLLNAQISS